MPRLSFASFSVAAVRVAAAGVGVSLLLSGCQGGNPPGSPPSESSSTTASPTSGATGSPSPVGPSATTAPSGVYKPADAKGKAQNVPVPVMPELAKENSKAGLEAFIGYWYAQLNYSYESGETGTLRPLSAANCSWCTSLRESVEAAWQDGRWVTGAGIRTAAVEMDFDPARSSQVAIVQVIQEAVEIRNDDGSLYQDPTPATNSASRAEFEFTDERWIMVDLGLIR